MKDPLITIAIPTCGRFVFLKKAIRSAISQNYKNVEIIVSDNASDPKYELDEEFSKDKRVVLYRYDERLSLAEHWNMCLSKATGEYFLLLSDDDYLTYNSISTLYNTIKTNSLLFNTYLVLGRTQVVDENDALLWKTKIINLKQEKYSSFNINFYKNERILFPCSTLYNTTKLKLTKGYPVDSCGPLTDIAAFLNVAKISDYVSLTNVVVSNYRIHRNNLTKIIPLNIWNIGIMHIYQVNLPDIEPKLINSYKYYYNYYRNYILMDMILNNIIDKNLIYIYKKIYFDINNINLIFSKKAYFKICLKTLFLKYIK